MNFLESQTPVFYYLKFYGFFCYLYNKNIKKLRTNCWIILYNISFTIMFQSIFLYSTFLLVHLFIGKMEEKTNTMTIVNKIEPFPLALGYILLNLFMICKKKDQMKFFENLSALELELRHLGFQKEFIKFNKRSMIESWVNFLGVQLFFIGLMISYYTNHHEENFAFYIFEVYLYVMNSMFDIYVLQFLSATAKTILNFNEIFKKHIESQSKLEVIDINGILELHQKIKAIMLEFADAFGIIFFLVYLILLGNLTTESYFTFSMIQEFNKDTSWSTFHYCVNNKVWQAFISYFMIKYLCHADLLNNEVSSIIFSSKEF